jgi:hypothetical protein
MTQRVADEGQALAGGHQMCLTLLLLLLPLQLPLLLLLGWLLDCCS